MNIFKMLHKFPSLAKAVIEEYQKISEIEDKFRSMLIEYDKIPEIQEIKARSREEARTTPFSYSERLTKNLMGYLRTK